MSRFADSMGAWITGIVLTALAFFTVAAILYLPLRCFCQDYTAKRICLAIATWIVAVAVISVFAGVFAVLFEPGWFERINANDGYFIWAVGAPFELFGQMLDRFGLWVVLFVVVFAMVSLILGWIGALFVVPGVVVWIVTIAVAWLWMTRILVPLFSEELL